MRRLVFIMMAIMIELFAGLQSHKIEPDMVKDGNYMGIKILDSKVANLGRIDGLKFCEISDIVYDKEDNILYALSDKGNIFKLVLEIERGKIKDLRLISGKELGAFSGKRLPKVYRDSEGMALVKKRGKTSFFIAFEKKTRVIGYDDNFNPKEIVSFPNAIKNIYNYQGEYDGLESLTYDKERGLLTASEYSLRSTPRGWHYIYSQKGRVCALKVNDNKNAIVELEMMPSGELLVLMRKFTWRTLSFETTLLKVDMQKTQKGICKSEILAWMHSGSGWDIDNFEGLTHLKENLYLMISDDNNNPFEKTILTLFEVKEK